MSGIRRLYAHWIIALDFDNTLIDHAKSPRLHDFVAQEYRRRIFWIVTHRTDYGACRLWSDLFHATFGRLRCSMFAGVVHLPLQLYDAYSEDQVKRAAGRLTGPLSSAELTFVSWKAEQAKELGCTVLVDDLAIINRLGCSRLGLEFVATDWL